MSVDGAFDALFGDETATESAEATTETAPETVAETATEPAKDEGDVAQEMGGAFASMFGDDDELSLPGEKVEEAADAPVETALSQEATSAKIEEESVKDSVDESFDSIFYNEKENILLIMSAILEQNECLEILVVDDGSPDGTGDLVQAEADKNPRIHLLRRKGKMGLGSAYVMGFKWALERDYERVFEMDADFSHAPTDLNRFLETAEDADLVLGSGD